jgi:hypothetical protein
MITYNDTTNLLQVAINVFGKLPKQHAEQISKKRSSQIESFLPKMVTIVQLTTLECCQQQPMNHVSKEVRFLGLRTLSH